MDKTAIVILNWNGVEMLTRFLPNVLDYSRDEAVVYVADNASTDNSLEVLKMHFPEVRVIVLEKMTFPNDKVLTIEMSEKQISGRTIALHIDYEDVLSADSFDAALLEEE